MKVSTLDREDVRPDIVHLVGGVNDIYHDLPRQPYSGPEGRPRNRLMFDVSRNEVDR